MGLPVPNARGVLVPLGRAPLFWWPPHVGAPLSALPSSAEALGGEFVLEAAAKELAPVLQVLCVVVLMLM